MANYNCTPAGCTQDPSGIYTSLSLCQTDCFKWGCPPTVDVDANLYFIYDISGSYDKQDIATIYTAATAYTATLTAGGWQGNEYHILTTDETYVRWPSQIYQTGLVRNGNAANTTIVPPWNACYGLHSDFDTIDPNGTNTPIAGINSNQFHVFDVGYGTGWDQDVYARYDPQNPFNPTKNYNQIVNGVPTNLVTCPTHPGAVVGGGVPPASITDNNVVVMFIDQSWPYSEGHFTGNMSHYEDGFQIAFPDGMNTLNGCTYTPPGNMQAIAIYTELLKWHGDVNPYVQNMGWNFGTGFNFYEGWNGESPTPEYTQAYIQHWATYSAVTAAGGQLKSVILPQMTDNNGSWHSTSTWINHERKFALQLVAQIDPGNKVVEDGTWLPNTAPGTIGGLNTIANLGHSQSTDTSIRASYCKTTNCVGQINGVAGTVVVAGCPFGLELSNPYWTPSNDYSSNGVNSLGTSQGLFAPSVLGSAYADANGFMINPDTGLSYTSSPTGNWGNLASMGWNYDISFSSVTTASLGATLNTFVGSTPNPNLICLSAETSGTIDYPYATDMICDSNCNIPINNSWYDCTNSGCVPSSISGNSTYVNLSACTAACQSYYCTTTGCSLNVGSGGMETLSACTATCIHYECTELCGCVVVPGFGDLSLDYVYSTSGQCKESCIGWKCYDDLGITENTKVYVYYDATSMGVNKIKQAYNGLQSYLSTLVGWNGVQNHQLGVSESWLGWPTAMYGPVTPWSGQLNSAAGGGGWDNTFTTLNPATYQYQGLRWIMGHDGSGFPDLSHWSTFYSAPPSINAGNVLTDLNDSVGQQTSDGWVNTNINNPNGAVGQLITMPYWGPTANTGDDVVSIIFADESHQGYHSGWYYPEWGSGGIQAPTPTWKSHYANYVDMWEWLEGDGQCSLPSLETISVSGTATHTPNFRAFLYPTKLSTYPSTKMKQFSLHALGAISVGNLGDFSANTPFTGVWSAGTTPRTTGTGNWDENNGMEYSGPPGYAPMSMSLLERSNVYMSTPNNTSSARFYSGGTGTSVSGISLNWGGLETMGWGMNVRFPNYNATTFSSDLNKFLSASTEQYTGNTICISAETLAGPTMLYPHLELSACTATCVNYDCSPNGCIINASDGQYGNLSACTAACQSYSCTTTGCSIYNVPYVATNGILDYTTSYGSGGTYFNTINSTPLGLLDAQLSCTTSCQKFICSLNGCVGEPGLAGGGEYSVLQDCVSACTSFNCEATYVSQTIGQPNFTGTIDACNSIPNNSGIFNDVNECITGCSTFSCSDIGCVQVNNQYGDYATLSACTAQCQSTECTNSGCVDQIGSGGTFFNLSSFATATASCLTQCTSFNCGPTGCSGQTGTGGTYTTDALCLLDCISYNCTDPGCIQQVGSGGTYFSETDPSWGLTACTAQCTSWECGLNGCVEDLTGTGGTYSTLLECQNSPCTSYDCSADGCILFNQPPTVPLPGMQYYGTGGQYATSGACSAACIGFECVNVTAAADTGCVEIEGSSHTYNLLSDCTGSCKTYTCSVNGCIIQNNSGGTYPYTVQGLAQCQTACTSYDCGTNDCTPVVGSGGTYWNATNPFLGYTTCTATCQSYNCYTTGCTLQVGTGGTFSAMSSCTAQCTSWECTTDCCQLYNSPYYGTGGTHTTQSGCTASCINWGCFQVVTGITTSTSKIYAYYDTTSMSFNATVAAIEGLNDWVATIPGFSGNLYHTLINDERWLGWGTSVYTGAFAGGNLSDSVDNAPAGLIYQWANTASITGIYDNCPAGQPFPFIGLNTQGPAPTAAITDDVIVVTFIDESSRPNFGLNTPSSISDYVYCGDDIGCGVPGCIEPQYGGLVANQLDDQVTETWRQDYTAFTTTYNSVTAATGTFNALMYPTESSSNFGSGISDRNRIFALHVVAAIDNGNKTPGAQGDNWLPGTAPRSLASGGLVNGVPALCTIADLTALEVSNPYVLEGYGKLRDKGWNYTINFETYTPTTFDDDITSFLSETSTAQGTGGTQCLSACTTMSYLYPYSTFNECTGNCISYECTIAGCVVSPNTGGTFSSLASCTGACISWSCTTTGTTSLIGTGTTGTHTDYNVVASGCNSFNCVYDPSSPNNQQGCQQQIGSGGTYINFSSCTAECKSWECTTNCLTNATGCTEHPNTGHTYVTLSACTGSCQVEWYCVPESIINSCSGQQVIGAPGGIINNGYNSYSPWVISSGYGALGWIAENDQFSSFGSYSFSMSEAQLTSQGVLPPYDDFCVGPYVLGPITPLPPVLEPGYLTVLDSVVITASGGTSPNFPQTFSNWSSLITFFQGLGANVNSGMYAYHVIQEIVGPWATSQNSSVFLDYIWSNCLCQNEPCYTLCDNGSVSIPGTAVGPFTTSGAAENSCCLTATTWNCSAGTVLDTCSGRTQINYPNQFANATEAWDWLTVNSPSSNLDTLKYESTTSAFGVDDVCPGPNGGILYEILPMSSPYINNNQSYATWDGFVAQLQIAGVTGILSGMSYTIVNSHFMAQSGHSLPTCVAMCTCRESDCFCVPVIGTGGTYTTSAACYTSCCSATTATSWECASEGPMQPICSAKTYMGSLDSPWAVLDNFRQNAPASFFASKKYITIYETASGVQTPTYTWNDVWGSVSATTYNWQDCYKYVQLQVGWPVYANINGYKKINYVEAISHPLVSGGFQYNNWNDFYTVAATVATLNVNMTVSGVCNVLSNIAGTGNYDCAIWENPCCSRRDCYCYELFTSGGTYQNQPDCIKVCCPMTGWTCYYANGVPQGNCVNTTNPIAPFFTSQSDCEDPFINTECFPETSWECITGTTIYSCDPSIDLYVDSPAISANSIEYPFTSSTTDLNGLPNFSPPQNLGGITGGNYGQGQVETILTNHQYLNPNTPFSSVTFEYCSGSTASCTGTTNCFPGGTNQVYGANNYPTYRMISISHALVHDYTPYYSWTSFITAAQGLGNQVSTAMTSQFLWLNTTFQSGRFISVMEPCTCYFDSKACECIEVPNSNHYPTSAACEQVCCPSGHPITYDCTINGCVDPGNGTGVYSINQYLDCLNECREWVCVSGNTVLNSCSGQTTLPGQGQLLPLYPGNPGSNIYLGTPYDALQYFANQPNSLQGSTFSNYKWDCAVGCSSTWGNIPSCVAVYGTYAKLVSCFIRPINYTTQQANVAMFNGPYTNWTDVLLDLNNNGYGQINSSMSLFDVQATLTATTVTQTSSCDNLINLNMVLDGVSFIAYISDPLNGYQTTTIGNIVYDFPCGGVVLNPLSSIPSCAQSNRCLPMNSTLNNFPNDSQAYRGRSLSFGMDYQDGNGLQSFTTYTDFINYTNIVAPNLGINLNTPFITVLKLMKDIWFPFGTVGSMTYCGCSQIVSEALELVPVWESCVCAQDPCGCVETPGTGHTSGFSYTQSATCEQICCSSTCVEECGVLICGGEEGVLYYDHISNTTIKLFDDIGFDFMDIAARQNKLWTYSSQKIKEYDVTWCPFTHTLNRIISVPVNMGKGLTPTNNPNILLTAENYVSEVDISGGAAVVTNLYLLPSGLTCTGDILWDESPGGPSPAHTIITFGSGSTYYVGKFTHPAGTLLEYSQITGLLPGESIDSLYGVSDSVTDIFGITTDKRVIQLLTNVSPLEFAPVQTQTLTLVNQNTDKVRGATNVMYGSPTNVEYSCTLIESGDAWWCMDIVGCQSYPGGIVPPGNQAGPFISQSNCQTQCNFGCGCDIPGNPCGCELTTSLVNPGSCTWYPTLALCQTAQPPVGQIQPGSGCCNCYGCESLTYQVWTTNNTTLTYTMPTNPIPAGGVVSWTNGQSYFPGDVVLFADPYGNRCCYVRVLDYCGSNPCPHDFITPWDSHTDYTNSLTLNTYLHAQYVPWVACDRDCPNVITYDCITGTSASSVLDDNSGCFDRFVIPPIAFTSTSPISLTGIFNYLSDQANGAQFTNINTMRYVLNNANSINNPCTDVSPIATPNSIFAWNALIQIGANVVANPNGATGSFTDTTWAGLVNQLASVGVTNTSGTLVDLTMNSTQIFTAINSGNGNGGLFYSPKNCSCYGGRPCYCQEIIGSTGEYPTSALCESNCCSGSTWSCDTNTIGNLIDSCSNATATGAQGLSFTQQISYIAGTGWSTWVTNFSSLKFELGSPAIPGGTWGSYMGTPLVPLGLNDTPCPVPNNTFGANYAKVLEVNSSVYPYDLTATGPYYTWESFIDALNASALLYTTGHIFNYSMNWQSVEKFCKPEAKWEFCVCSPEPCRGTCIELFDGSGLYSTQAECLTACCPTYDCTSTGCVNPINGLGAFTSLTQCQLECQQYDCQPGTSIALPPCDSLIVTPAVGSINDIVAYFADGTTAPIPPQVNNMQGAIFSDYKVTLAGVTAPFTSTCPNEVNLGWPVNSTLYLGDYVMLTGINIVYTSGGGVVAGPFTKWSHIIQHMDSNMGFPVSFSMTYTQVQVMLASKHLTIDPTFRWCECTNTDCDCVLIPGTGTTQYNVNQYLNCYSACCEETFDCTDTGCVSNTTGTGAFTSFAQCQVVCVEYRCVSATTLETCEGRAPIPISNCNQLPLGLGTLTFSLVNFFSNSTNNLTWASFNQFKYDQFAPAFFNSQTPNCNGNMCTQSVYHYFSTLSIDNGWPAGHQYEINTGPQTSWGSFVNAVNQSNGVNNYLMVGFSPNVSAVVILAEINSVPSNPPGAKVPFKLGPISPCICEAEDCHCPEVIGTGNTPTQDYYPTSASCESVCCDDKWYCEPNNATHQCECLVGTPPLGAPTYPTLLACKKDVNNCCKDNYFDCKDGFCISLLAGVIGPYATAAACNAAILSGECEGDPETGYDCVSVIGPVGGNNQACIPCLGGGCQYTTLTAAGAPFFGNALTQCQAQCEGGGEPCWQCCRDNAGQIFQLLLTANPCICPEDTTPVACDGRGPCEFPVSCQPGFTFNNSTCKCECDQNVSCAPGYIWSVTKCKCVPNVVGPMDVTTGESEMIVKLSEYYNLPIPTVAEELSDAIDKLEILKASGYEGDGCQYCPDPEKGVCLFNGCLTLEDLEDRFKPTSIVCYEDGIPLYSRPSGADGMARKLGCIGSHSHVCKNGIVGYMACPTHDEAMGRFKSLKSTKIKDNRDPELYNYMKEQNKLQPQIVDISLIRKPVSPYDLPDTNPGTSGGGDGSGGEGSGGEVYQGSCCEWCAVGTPGIPPRGCSDHDCAKCRGEGRNPGEDTQNETNYQNEEKKKKEALMKEREEVVRRKDPRYTGKY